MELEEFEAKVKIFTQALSDALQGSNVALTWRHKKEAEITIRGGRVAEMYNIWLPLDGQPRYSLVKGVQQNTHTYARWDSNDYSN